MLFDRVNPFLVMLVAGALIVFVVVFGPKPGKVCYSMGPCSACYTNMSDTKPASACNATEGYVCMEDLEVKRRNALADLYACLCDNGDEAYSNYLLELQNALGIESGDVCSVMPSKWRERYVPVKQS